MSGKPERMELKRLHQESLPAALERAKHYRLLNDPRPAESICEDILAIDPDNQEARRIQLLSMCDRFATTGRAGMRQAMAAARQLGSAYAREYYQGLVLERIARVEVNKRMPEYEHICYEYLEDALEHYQKAEELAEDGNDEALLRWNHCVRMLRAHPELKPRAEQPYVPALLE